MLVWSGWCFQRYCFVGARLLCPGLISSSFSTNTWSFIPHIMLDKVMNMFILHSFAGMHVEADHVALEYIRIKIMYNGKVNITVVKSKLGCT